MQERDPFEKWETQHERISLLGKNGEIDGLVDLLNISKKKT